MCDLTEIADVARSSQLLKGILSLLTKNGYTYEKISNLCAEHGSAADASAIKQFVYRSSGKPRNTKTFRSIVKAINILMGSPEIKSIEVYSDLLALHKLLVAEIAANPGKLIDQSQIGVLEKSKKISQNTYVARHYCLVRRYSRHDQKDDQKKLREYVRIFINVWEYESNKYKFLMKINGIYGRRVVLGDVYETNSGITMWGLSLPVNEFVDANQFITMSNDTLLNGDNIIVPNPVGFEIMSLPRIYLGDAFIPAAFSGVNGEGTSIFGNGICINLDAAGKNEFHDNFLNVGDDEFASALEKGKFAPMSDSLAFRSLKTHRGFSV